MSAASDQPLQHTPLYDLHVELGAKLVPFTGYSLPVQYEAGIMKEHNHTREKAGLFDVSHMGQVLVKGTNAVQALEKLIPIDIGALDINKQSYAVLTNEQGGIMDDLIVTRWGEDEFFLVINAACKEADLAHLRQHMSHLSVELLSDRALLALQGPKAHTVMQELVPEACELTFMTGCWGTITIGDENSQCFITRSGYTGEDGFEISVPARDAEQVARRILADDNVLPIGLGARDSLRLEAGLCLYGHDMDQHTSPIEAGLIWSISKSRRSAGEKAGGFLGAETVLSHIDNGVSRKRVGFAVDGRAPVREGTLIVNEADQEVGKITSGGFGPTIGHPVAMGYVEADYTAVGTTLFALVRNKKIPVSVAKMPFVKQSYVR